MNILNFLTKEKRVAGIEISDSVVRIAFFRPNRKKEETVAQNLVLVDSTRPGNISRRLSPEEDGELVLIEEPIEANIIANGVVLDVALLGKTLKGIWEKSKIETAYAIVAIPDDEIYSRIFSFPKSVEGTRLTEAMRLAITFQLPMKTEDIYLDWEKTAGTSTLNEILLSTIPKEVAGKYIDALELAGIKILALESHLASIARAVEHTPGETTIFSKKSPDGATIFELQDGILRFSRYLPYSHIPEGRLPAEIEKVKSALEAQLSSTTPKIIHVEELANAKVRGDYAHMSDLAPPNGKWLIALGAAIRGRIPEGEDNLVSLLPVGTEEAYAYQKATMLISLLRNMTVGVSVFFIIAFLSAYLFVVSLSRDANSTVTTLGASSVPTELLAKEATINKVNALTETAGTILSTTPLWSALLNAVEKKITDGITISSFSATDVSGTISMTGIAHDRVTLNDFKKSLQEGGVFTEVTLPITNLEQKENIPFSTTFRIVDTSKVYYK